MSINELIDLFRKTPQYEELKHFISSNENHLLIESSVGSHKSFVIASCFLSSPFDSQRNIVVCNDKEAAMYLYNDLVNILAKVFKNPGEKIYYFPSSGSTPYDYSNRENANILNRAETINKLNSESKQLLIITYPEALAEKVIIKQELVKNTLLIKQGEKLSLDFVIDLLIEYQFERVDYVFEPGQFSIRGGIADIYSFASEMPYRIEFSGDEVESVRSFDVESQLSTASFSFVYILPDIQHKQIAENYQSLCSFAGDNCIYWIENFDLFIQQTESLFSKANESYKNLQSTIKQSEPNKLFVSGNEMQKEVENFINIHFAKSNSVEINTKINYRTKPQPSFNKNFPLLIEELKNNHQKKLKTIILTDNPKQVERIESIIKDVSGKNDVSDLLHSAINLSVFEGFVDFSAGIAVYTDHQIFNRYYKYKPRTSFKHHKEALTLKELNSLQQGDYVSHIDHGIGKFDGLEKIEVNGKLQEAIRLIYQDNDLLYVSIHSLHKISKYSGSESSVPKINKLGSNQWNIVKQKAKKKVKELAYDLIKLYAKRKSAKGFAFAPDNYLQIELEASFLYEDTPDQEKATTAVKKDMEASYPMDRLICGDVGFGKTEIAIRAAFKAVCDSKQVVILVPTTILALQHYKTFSERLKDFPCTIDYLNRFKSYKEQKETVKKTAEGKVDILIGTHRILGKDLKFKDLGLLIIDEEQKFGVSAKDKLKQLKHNVDTLTLTATPIPRTLQFSMMGARDLSIIATPPPNRFPVQTEVHIFNETTIRDAIAFELERGGQVFFIHNRVQNITEIAALISRMVPDAKISVGHGQMEGDELEHIMTNFIDGKTNVLISTTIIESGLDISNANTIIINNAHQFGMSDLHQMRGRVGRSNKKAYCFLLAPPLSVLTNEAKKRLKTLEEFSDLGSGFNIALRDLDIRGAGNLLGAEQSGFINDIGFEMYMKILEEAIFELKENDAEYREIANEAIQVDTHFKQIDSSVFVRECNIDTDFELLIPSNYVSESSERIILYKELDDLEKDEELAEYLVRLKDRFGDVPESVTELVETIKLRRCAKKLGFEKIILKNQKMICHFIMNKNSSFYQSENFGKVLEFIKTYPDYGKFIEKNEKLSYSFDNVKTVNKASQILHFIDSFVNSEKAVSI